MGFNSAFKGLKIVKNPGNGRLNNFNDPVLNVLIYSKVSCINIFDPTITQVWNPFYIYIYPFI